MNFFGLMETSGSAMQAERMRAEVVAANMANAETTRTASGGPYHRQHVVFAANPAATNWSRRNGDPGFLESLAGASGMPLRRPGSRFLCLVQAVAQPAGGVHIAQVVADPAPPLKRYDPAIRTRDRMAMSRIRTLIPSQRWWT